MSISTSPCSRFLTNDHRSLIADQKGKERTIMMIRIEVSTFLKEVQAVAYRSFSRGALLLAAHFGPFSRCPRNRQEIPLPPHSSAPQYHHQRSPPTGDRTLTGPAQTISYRVVRTTEQRLVQTTCGQLGRSFCVAPTRDRRPTPKPQ
jgi:hypothetical protein